MKITRNEFIIGITAVCLLFLVTCWNTKRIQKAEDSKDAKTAIIDNIRTVSINKYDSLKIYADATDKLMSKMNDTLRGKFNFLVAKENNVKNNISDNDKRIDNESQPEKEKEFTEVTKDTSGTIKKVEDSNNKDTLLAICGRKLVIAEQKFINDSIAREIVKSVIPAADKVVKADSAKINLTEPRHPNLKAFWTKVKQTVEIVAASIVGTLATKGAVDIYQGVK